MSTFTPRLGLRRPDVDDYINVLEAISLNYDILDNCTRYHASETILGEWKFYHLSILDSSQVNFLNFKTGSLTSNKELKFEVNDSDRVLNLLDDVTLGNWFDFLAGILEIKTGPTGLKIDSEGRVAINGEINEDAILNLESDSKVVILPSLEEEKFNLLTPVEGMIAYDKTNKKISFYNGEEWVALG